MEYHLMSAKYNFIAFSINMPNELKIIMVRIGYIANVLK